MGTIVVAGATWVLLLAVFLWFNYSFHRFLTIKTGSLSSKAPQQHRVKAMAGG